MAAPPTKVEELAAKLNELTTRNAEKYANLGDEPMDPLAVWKDISQFLKPGPGLLASSNPEDQPGANPEATPAIDYAGAQEDSDDTDEDEPYYGDSEDEFQELAYEYGGVFEASSPDNHATGELDEATVQEIRTLVNSTLLPFLEECHEVIWQKDTILGYRELDRKAGLLPEFESSGAQRRASALMIKSLVTKFRGLIIADVPGMGKTLTALLAVYAKSAEHEGGTSVVVAPTSICQHWVRESDKFFGSNSSIISVLDEEELSPMDITKYRIVVTTYHRLSAEIRRRDKYLNDIKAFRAGKTKKLPERPRLLLLSGVFHCPAGTPIGNFLILDEAHAIKNTSTAKFRAVAELRISFRSCVMLSGTPLDTRWDDAVAYFRLLYCIPIYKKHTMHRMFTEWGRGSEKLMGKPSGEPMSRLGSLLNAVMLRRPRELVTSQLPALFKQTITFTALEGSIVSSDAAFRAFRKLVAKKEFKEAMMAVKRAQQHIQHPFIVQHSALAVRIEQAEKQGLDDPNALAVNRVAARWNKAKNGLEVDRAYRSPRVFAVIDAFHQHRDRMRVGDGFLVVDDSVCFLDILELAFKDVGFDLPVFRYDGRRSASERDRILQEFTEGSGTRVMLMTRAAGGQGLNIQAANVIILCTPVWSQSWVDQTVAQCHRRGQTRPVYYYAVEEATARVDRHMVKRMNAKHAVNESCYRLLERADEARTPTPPHPPM